MEDRTMNMNKIGFIVAAALAAAAPGAARAHCDALDGPVVKAAERALAAGKPDAALAWVSPAGEAEVREAYARAVAARRLGPEARTVADRWFFETLVRVHRAGEGAPFTGLRPAGLGAGPAVEAADRAVESGDLRPVEALLDREVRDGLAARFREVKARRAAAGTSVEAGRAFVAAYVPFVHFVEGVHRAASTGPSHGAEAAASAEPAPQRPHQHE
jgi:hypothetical protein